MSRSRRTLLRFAGQIGIGLVPGGWLRTPDTGVATVGPGELQLICTADGVHLRDRPGLASSVIGVLTFGGSVHQSGDAVIKDGYTWLPISGVGITGDCGWGISAYFDDGDVSRDFATGSHLAVASDERYLRAAAALSGPDLFTVVRGDVVTTTADAIRRDGFTWYEVRLADDTSGFLAGEFLRPAAEP